MKYKIEELEKMSTEDLVEVYSKSKKSAKKDILKTLVNSNKFTVLMDNLSPTQLMEMAKIHPYKEVVVDTIIDGLQSHGLKNMSKYFDGNFLQSKFFAGIMDELQHKNFFSKVKETITRKKALPETLPKKIKLVYNLCEIENRRSNATGKKLEKLEKQELDQAVDKSRVEVNNGEMAKIFDRYAKETRKDGKFFGRGEQKQKLLIKLKHN